MFFVPNSQSYSQAGRRGPNYRPDCCRHRSDYLRTDYRWAENQPRSEVAEPPSHSFKSRCPISANSGCSFV